MPGIINILIKGEAGQAIAEIRATGREVETLGHKTAKTASGMRTGLASAAKVSTYALAGLAVEGVAAFRAAERQQVAETKLAAVVRRLGLAWLDNKDAIEKNLTAQSEMSGFLRADLSQTLAKNLITTKNLSEAFRLNALTMDLARTKGMDLQTAQQLIARTYNGSTIGLKRLGIAITPVTAAQDALKASTDHATDAQKRAAKQADLLATGQKAIAELQQKIGNQAEAYGKTTAGAQDKFRVAAENLQETLGAGLLPVMTDLFGVANEVAGAIGHNADTAKTAAVAIASVSTAIIAVNTAWKAGEFFAALSSPQWAAIGVTTLAIALAFEALRGKTDDLTKSANDAVVAINGLSDAVANVKTATAEHTLAVVASKNAHGAAIKTQSIVNQQLRDGKKGTQENTLAVRANKEAWALYALAQERVRQTTQGVSDAQQKQKDTLDKARGAQFKMNQAASLGNDGISRLRTTIHQVTARTHEYAQKKLEVAAAAEAEADKLRAGAPALAHTLDLLARSSRWAAQFAQNMDRIPTDIEIQVGINLHTWGQSPLTQSIFGGGLAPAITLPPIGGKKKPPRGSGAGRPSSPQLHVHFHGVDTSNRAQLRRNAATVANEFHRIVARSG